MLDIWITESLHESNNIDILIVNSMLLLLFFLPRKPIFTPSQVDRLSNIFDSAGQVAFGADVVSPLFSRFDKTSLANVLLGIAIVSLCWSFSIWLAKKKDQE